MASARNLVVTRSATDRIVLDDRLVDVNGGADCLRFADGRSLSVAALVQAMAAFGTPAGGERSLARADVQQYLTPLLAPGAQGVPGKAGRRGLAQRGKQPDSPPPAGVCRWLSLVLRLHRPEMACAATPLQAQDGSSGDGAPNPAPTKPVARAR